MDVLCTTLTTSDLPFELIQEIFEISAKSSSKQAAILARVSRHVYNFVKPILLRTFVFRDRKVAWPGQLDHEWLQSNGKYARNLLWCLGASSDATFLPIVLVSCRNLTNIAIWADIRYDHIRSVLESPFQLRPRRLSININTLSRGPFQENHARLPIFLHLTHLEMASSIGGWSTIEGIQYLPKLTHLSLPVDSGDLSTLQSVLELCKHLAVLILYSSCRERRTGPGEVAVEVPLQPWVEDIGDPRIVSLESAYVEDWEVGSQGGRDMWTLAEEMVKRRALELLRSGPH
ncbi:hypothetical protein BDN72DRAFT_900373 [Pluteus cervinus]|uniref:Uncharacterized protein n=1 Tax=Pluteus cervinus TaxID=181527 RepID=A0ACD3AJH5_9AGAR|nr:hypothetical protein BDN72DRAFT_900373 [Pluteus cervinus]